MQNIILLKTDKNTAGYSTIDLAYAGAVSGDVINLYPGGSHTITAAKDGVLIKVIGSQTIAVQDSVNLNNQDLSFVDFTGSTKLNECTYKGTNLTGATNFTYATRFAFLTALAAFNSLSSLQDLLDNDIIDERTKWIDGNFLVDNSAGEIMFSIDLETLDKAVVWVKGFDSPTLQISGALIYFDRSESNGTFLESVSTIRSTTEPDAQIYSIFSSSGGNYQTRITLPTDTPGVYTGLFYIHVKYYYDDTSL